MTTAPLVLERFDLRSLDVEPPRGHDDADLALARMEGEAAGRAAAEAAGLAALTAAVEDLAAALREDGVRREAIRADAGQAIITLTRTMISTLAPAFRAEMIVEAVAALLAQHIRSAETTLPAIGCETRAQPALRSALDAAGLRHLPITTVDSGAELASTGGLLRIDLDRVRSSLEQIITDMKEKAA